MASTSLTTASVAKTLQEKDEAAVSDHGYNYSCSFVVNELRWASNKGTLRAFRNARRFSTFKIFRRPGRSSTTCRSRSIAAI